MKQLFLLALLLMLGIAGAKAQITEHKFPSIKMKKLDLNEKNLGKDPSSFLESLNQNGVTSRYLQDDDKSKVNFSLKKHMTTKMPIIKPDTTIKFHVLAVKPDSAILYHMPVKKPY